MKDSFENEEKNDKKPRGETNAVERQSSKEPGKSKWLSTVKVQKKEAQQLTLAEEVEKRKKRLAKERERRTTRILVIIMLSFIGCWFPFFTRKNT